MRTCALYVKGVTPEECLDEQFAQLRKMAARRNLQVVAEYSDRCAFGNARRRGLEALLTDARRKKFEVVVVPSLSTMFRSTRELLQVMNDFRKCGVGLVSVKEKLSTSGRSARTAFRILSGISGLEADLHREKVCFGIYLAQAPRIHGRAAVSRGQQESPRGRPPSLACRLQMLQRNTACPEPALSDSHAKLSLGLQERNADD